MNKLRSGSRILVYDIRNLCQVSDLESVRHLIEGMPADEAKRHITEKFPDVVKKARYTVVVHVLVSKFSIAE